MKIQLELWKTNSEISRLRKSILNTAEFTPDGVKSVTWPIGNQPGNRPLTRFDVLRWDYFTETRIYSSTDFNNVRELNEAEKQDVKVDFV